MSSVEVGLQLVGDTIPNRSNFQHLAFTGGGGCVAALYLIWIDIGTFSQAITRHYMFEQSLELTGTRIC